MIPKGRGPVKLHAVPHTTRGLVDFHDAHVVKCELRELPGSATSRSCSEPWRRSPTVPPAAHWAIVSEQCFQCYPARCQHSLPAEPLVSLQPVSPNIVHRPTHPPDLSSASWPYTGCRALFCRAMQRGRTTLGSRPCIPSVRSRATFLASMMQSVQITEATWAVSWLVVYPKQNKPAGG